VGKKSATRFTYTLLKSPEEISRWIEVLTEIRNHLRLCSLCGNFTSEDPCSLCKERKEAKTLCVVAQPTDIPVVEKSGAYKGAYFVLHGVLDPSQGKTLYDLPLPQLRKRVEGGRFEEVILALNPTQEGEATARVIQDLLKNLPVKITRPAYGIPIGSQLDFVDEYTLSLAFRHRRSVEETP